MKNRFFATAAQLGAVVALVALAGCAQLERDIGECEPGVGGMSGMATVTPSGTGPC
ncbi:hypothetical protein AXZ77_1254 [Thioclava sp. ES.031]|uniref:hypothetical protein n=1 Tax=Thioclava sp. ES.031 TaxID=1798203 RepID=UPI000C00D984|nr:hypothetical protein [Thioclava sp. ES.031]PFG62670.1 hypothetical protein AXZ77_1254 [Thioclava sp. ES.031]